MTQTIAQQIKWDFEKNGFLEIKDKNGNQIYFEHSDGYWEKREYDSQDNLIYFEDSNGYWRKHQYDSLGNEIYHEDSFRYWSKREWDSEGNQIYYENSNGEIEDNRPKPLEIPTSISVGVYYYIDEETGKPVFDTESMTNEFETKLNNL